ncbi:Cell invasion protein SipB [Pseudomonas fluorescens]|uniref:type III secretion system translocon subunit SctE n=1 Tax=Pseudomonas fluorescens TaxID=294 RepID=UPI00124139BC|nr:type III secretion system translocon subunit SctE [Pseudomonas fluorescens]VVP32530.1 Cell invasion protein SipB [Pseudomonas fluorescens]
MTLPLISNSIARHVSTNASGLDKDLTKAASKSASTENYIRAADFVHGNAQKVLYKESSQIGADQMVGRPQLAPPKAETETGEDRFTFLMATLMGLLGEVEVTSLKSRLAILRNMAEASAKGNQALSERYLAAVAELEAAVSGASSSMEKLEAAKADLESARQELASAQKTLAEARTGTPEYDAALAARDVAQSKVDAATQAHSGALQAFNAATQKAAQMATKAEELAKEITAGVATPEAHEGMQNQLDANSKMILLMTKFAELMGESAENKVEAQQELFRSMQASRQEYMEKKSEEYLEQVRKAEAANKAMGCIGKWISVAIAVISVIAVPFTGGASLALGAIGIGLMAADMLVKELTGTSFMAEAMKPLMDKVLGPLIQAIGKAITDALMSLGVDESAAKIAGNVIGAIIGAIAMVAVIAVVAVVGKGAAGRIASSMGNMLGKMVSKMAPEVLKNAVKSVGSMATKAATSIRSTVGLSSDKLALEMYGTRLGMAVTGTEIGGSAAQSGFGAKSGIHQADAAKKMAEVSLAVAISEQLRTYLSENVQMFEDMMNDKNQMMEKFGDMQQRSADTALNMVRNI